MPIGRTRTLTLAALVGLSLTGCSAGTPAVHAAATTPTTSTSPAPSATTPTPSVTPSPAGNLRPGQTSTSGGVASATFYAYKQPVAPKAERPVQDGYTWGAIDIKLCAIAGTDPNLSISDDTWTLVYSDDTTAKASNIRYNQFPQPSYPSEDQLEWGHCLRGWLTFAVPADKHPTAVRWQVAVGSTYWSVT